MIRPIVRPIVSGIARAVTGVTYKRRYAYNFDGVDDRGSLELRAIDPDGDIRIKFKTGAIVPTTTACVVDQSTTAVFTDKEFYLQFNAGLRIQVIHGGNYLSSNTNAPPVEPNTTYEVRLIGNTLTYYRNGVLNQTVAIVRGTKREPTAVTKIGAWSGSPFGGFYSGQLFDIEINGTLWPMSAKDYTIQLPSPSGLGSELITQSVLENPVSKGSQWNYLGAGRWQYVGDGSFNELRFIAGASHPASGFLDFEIEAITGTLSCVSGSTAIPRASFTTPGKKRYFYTDLNEGSALGAAVAFKRPSNGVVTSCILKNISFKPLGTCNPLTMVNTTPERWEVV